MNNYKMYLIENMDEDICYILDNAVIIALNYEEAKSLVKEEWPELNKVSIIELSQDYINQLMIIFPEEKILCKGVIHE